MKKLIIGLLLLTGCSTAMKETPGAPESTTPKGVSAAPVVVPLNPLEPLEGETREAFLERQIAMVASEIMILEPKVIAASNSMDPKFVAENAKMRDQLFDLERKKASLELQLLSLP